MKGLPFARDSPRFSSSSKMFSAACATAIVHRNQFFRLYLQNKSSESKIKFRQASNYCKRVLEAAKVVYATKTNEPITSQKLGSRDFWQIANSVLKKSKFAIPPPFNGPEVLPSASDKAKLFAKNFSKNSNLVMSLPVFHFRINVKLHNISRTPKMVKKVITNLESSKPSGPDCLPVVVLKKCGPELSYILAELFNMCLKEPCFPDCWKVSSVVPEFKNVRERSSVKKYRPVSLLSMVSKVLDRIVDHIEKYDLSSDFQYGFRPSQSTVDLLTVASDRIAGTFNMSGATRAVALNISKVFDRVWHAGLLHKHKSYRVLGQMFGLISSCLNNRQLPVFWMENLHKNIQLMLEFIKGPFLVLHFSYFTLMIFLMLSVMGAIYADDTTLSSKCDRASDLLQQLELASELESDL